MKREMCSIGLIGLMVAVCVSLVTPATVWAENPVTPGELNAEFEAVASKAEDAICIFYEYDDRMYGPTGFSPYFLDAVDKSWISGGNVVTVANDITAFLSSKSLMILGIPAYYTQKATAESWKTTYTTYYESWQMETDPVEKAGLLIALTAAKTTFDNKLQAMAATAIALDIIVDGDATQTPVYLSIGARYALAVHHYNLYCDPGREFVE